MATNNSPQVAITTNAPASNPPANNAPPLPLSKPLDRSFIELLLSKLYPPGTASPLATFGRAQKKKEIPLVPVLKALITHAPHPEITIEDIWTRLSDATPELEKHLLKTPDGNVTLVHGNSWDLGGFWTILKGNNVKIDQGLKIVTTYYIDNVILPIRNTEKPRGGDGPGRDPDFGKDLYTRDQSRCVITGTSSDKAANLQPNSGVLNASHIIAHSLLNGSKVEARFAVAMFIWGRRDLHERLKDSIDTASNGILLSSDCHLSFDRLQWSIEALRDDSTNLVTYRVRFINQTAPKSGGLAVRHGYLADHKVLVFGAGNVQGQTSIPLPDPDFCNTHHAICSIIKMAGMADVFDELADEEDADDPPVSSSWRKREHSVREEDKKTRVDDDSDDDGNVKRRKVKPESKPGEPMQFEPHRSIEVN